MKTHSMIAKTGAVCVALGVALSAGCGGQGDESAETTGTTGTALTAAPSNGRYIVVFKSGVAAQGVTGRAVADVAAAMQQQYGGGRVLYTYQHALEGAAVELPAGALDAVRADSRVAYVEPDRLGSVVGTESNPPWGLDRLDQRNLPLDNSYAYPDQAGSGVHAYVIDSGVYAAHPEFTGAGGASRVIPGVDFQDNDADPDDCLGHGTHVAGIIGSSTYGVAKQVTLHSIRVVDCYGSGYASTAIAAVDYVTHNHQPFQGHAHVGPSDLYRTLWDRYSDRRDSTLSIESNFVHSEKHDVLRAIRAIRS